MAFIGKEKELACELDFWKIKYLRQGLYFFVESEDCRHIIFARDVWSELQHVTFNSISEATKALKTHKCFWFSEALDSFRRAQLIQEGLPSYKLSPISFLKYQEKSKPFGAWLMLDSKHLVYSLKPRSQIPLNQFQMIEDKLAPPNRAYLKLWEAFTFHLQGPQAGEKVIDVGSSPGGWTWVLSEMGAEVFSFDKSELREDISARKNVHFKAADVFKLLPNEWGPVDWFLSDIICAPEKLLELVLKWIQSGMAQNFLCTLKFKGDINFQLMRDWAEAIEKAEVKGVDAQQFLQRKSGFIHLHQNKNEVTWYFVHPDYLISQK